jgi:hypothetical protein
MSDSSAARAPHKSDVKTSKRQDAECVNLRKARKPFKFIGYAK